MTISLPVELFAFPLLSVLLYWPCVNGTAIFDDLQTLPESESFRFGWESFRRMPRALTQMTYRMNQVWPGTFRGLHVGNALIHAGNAWIVEAIGLALGADRPAAMMAGLFVLAAPLAANTVGYISGRAALLSAMFGFAAVLAVVSGWAWLALPMLGLAAMSKEDGVGYAVTVVAVAVWCGDFVFAGAVVVAGAVLAYGKRAHWRRLYSLNANGAMKAAGLPVSLPQPDHGWVVLRETLKRLPFWMVGVKQSPYHGSGIKK